MRHGNKVNHLGRKKGHRRALLKNMACALIQHKRINTTLAKAKALRLYVEPLVTKSKSNTTHSRRVVFGYLQSKDAIQELFGIIAEKVANRPGGYLRILKTGFRKGDGAEMAMIEFVDFNEVMLAAESAGAGKKRRTRRGGSTAKKAATETAVAPVQEVSAPVVEEETTAVEDEPVAEAGNTEEANSTSEDQPEEQ